MYTYNSFCDKRDHVIIFVLTLYITQYDILCLSLATMFDLMA